MEWFCFSCSQVTTDMFVSCNPNAILSSFMTYHRVCKMYHNRYHLWWRNCLVLRNTPRFSVIRVTRTLVACVVLCRSLSFVSYIFFFWRLCFRPSSIYCFCLLPSVSSNIFFCSILCSISDKQPLSLVSDSLWRIIEYWKQTNKTW